jgi:hypothetical protein
VDEGVLSALRLPQTEKYGHRISANHPGNRVILLLVMHIRKIMKTGMDFMMSCCDKEDVHGMCRKCSYDSHDDQELAAHAQEQVLKDSRDLISEYAVTLQLFPSGQAAIMVTKFK